MGGGGEDIMQTIANRDMPKFQVDEEKLKKENRCSVLDVIELVHARDFEVLIKHSSIAVYSAGERRMVLF
jgi:hypothetical protein